MRNRFLGSILGLALVAIPVSPALADTTGGGGSGDLGLESITITSGTVAAKTGVVTLHGVVTCSQDVAGSAWASTSQLVGRFHTIWGSGGGSFDCAAAQGWAPIDIVVRADQGKYAPGAVTVDSFAEAAVCGEDDCIIDDAAFGPATMRITRH